MTTRHTHYPVVFSFGNTTHRIELESAEHLIAILSRQVVALRTGVAVPAPDPSPWISVEQASSPEHFNVCLRAPGVHRLLLRDGVSSKLAHDFAKELKDAFEAMLVASAAAPRVATEDPNTWPEEGRMVFVCTPSGATYVIQRNRWWEPMPGTRWVYTTDLFPKTPALAK